MAFGWVGKTIKKVGKGIEKGFRGVRDMIIPKAPDLENGEDPTDTAQQQADKAQSDANDTIARRKKKKSLLGDADSGNSLLGE